MRGKKNLVFDLIQYFYVFRKRKIIERRKIKEGDRERNVI